MKLGVVMDPIANINIRKDSTFAMLLEAQRRQWDIYYMTHNDLFIDNDSAWGNMARLSVFEDDTKWFEHKAKQKQSLDNLDIILMRKDPPFDMDYIFCTYILELAEQAGVLVANKPKSLRDANEKIFATHFSSCTPPLRVSMDLALLLEFIDQHQNVILKPLDGMGGQGITRVNPQTPNLKNIIKQLTHSGSRLMMAQRFIEAIRLGDKRVLMINGEPVPYALARIPAENDFRGNLAAGATAQGQPLSERDYEIARIIGPTLKAKGLYFVGLDIIGDYLTEVNVTSPTCIRELDTQFDLNISAQLLDCLEQTLDINP